MDELLLLKGSCEIILNNLPNSIIAKQRCIYILKRNGSYGTINKVCQVYRYLCAMEYTTVGETLDLGLKLMMVRRHACMIVPQAYAIELMPMTLRTARLSAM